MHYDCNQKLSRNMTMKMNVAMTMQRLTHIVIMIILKPLKSKKSPDCITHHQILFSFHKYVHILHCSLNMCLSQFPLCL